MKHISDYWDKQWTERVPYIEGHPQMNIEKMTKIIHELAKIPEYADFEKLDIGCGTGVHALHLGNIFIGWRKKYTGIDLSEKAIEYAQRHGLNCICGNIFEYNPDKKFELFLLLDSLEHIKDRDTLASKINILATDKFYIFGNVPMTASVHEKDIEYPLSLHDLCDFLQKTECDMTTFVYDIYGSRGIPFLMFSASGEK